MYNYCTKQFNHETQEQNFIVHGVFSFVLSFSSFGEFSFELVYCTFLFCKVILLFFIMIDEGLVLELGIDL